MASDLKFGIELKDEMSGPAKAASGSLAGLSSQLKSTRTDLAGYQAQLARAKSLGDIEGYRKYSGLVEGAKRSVFDLSQQVEGLGKKTQSGLSMVGDAVGTAATGFVALGVAAAAAVVSIGAITFSALSFAKEATEAKDHAVALFQAMGDGSEGAGEKTLALIDGLKNEIPQTRKELVGWTREFEALGITDLGQLRTQLKATASAQALVGDSGAEAYTTLTRKIQAFVETGQGLKLPLKGLGGLAKVGLDVRDVAAEMGVSAAQLGAQLKAGTADATKFGAALETALIKKGSAPLTNLNLELSTVLSKGWESFTKLFDSVDFRPLSDALHFLFGLLDEGPEHGSNLKDGITDGLNGIIGVLREATVQATVFFLNVETWAIQNKGALREMWTFAKDGASLFWAVLKEVASELKTIGGFVVKLGEGLGYVADKLGLIDVGAHANTPEEFERNRRRQTVDAYARSHGAGDGGRPFAVAPAHAKGGLVMRPAPGEAFASVAPGERILPREQSQQRPYERYSVAAGIADGAYGARRDVRGEGHKITIDRVELNIHAPHGVTDATEVSARSLAVAIERYQLSSGR